MWHSNRTPDYTCCYVLILNKLMKSNSRNQNSRSPSTTYKTYYHTFWRRDFLCIISFLLRNLISLLDLPFLMWKRQKDCTSQRWWVTPRKQCLPDTAGLDAQQNSRKLWQHAWQLYRFKPNKVPALRGGSGGRVPLQILTFMSLGLSLIRQPLRMQRKAATYLDHAGEKLWLIFHNPCQIF